MLATITKANSCLKYFPGLVLSLSLNSPIHPHHNTILPKTGVQAQTHTGEGVGLGSEARLPLGGHVGWRAGGGHALSGEARLGGLQLRQEKEVAWGRGGGL